MSERNKALLRRSVEEAWLKGDMAVADEVYAADVILHSPLTGETTGIDAVKGAIRAMRAAVPDVQMRIEHLIAEGDMVVNHTSMTGTHKGEYAGIPPSGKPFKAEGVSIVRVADGKIAEIWGLTNVMEVLRGVGTTPS
jgi:steroid delta-isomerase-like uncharacterized protein